MGKRRLRRFCQTSASLPPQRRSIRQGLEIAAQRRAAAVEPIEAPKGSAQLVEVLYRRLVQAAVGIACPDPQTVDPDITRRELATQRDNSQSASVHPIHPA